VTLLLRTIAIMIAQNTQYKIQLTHPDLVIKVLTEGYDTFDFDQAEAISQIGKDKTDEELKQFERIKQSFWRRLLQQYWKR
ncbi:MAG: phospholipase, partial [Prevotella salivae]|nr:phospholipase [Segatella salivae]